ncbi:hypothetical protein [Nostoc sp.]|uniref:hypothetical protein n=1 Tax=Nostoc sp. TaxID=1180 RepID=UPI002FF8801A
MAVKFFHQDCLKARNLSSSPKVAKNPYDVQILDFKGKLLIDDPKVRQKIVQTLDWYAKFYQQGYVPPDAINWLNPDNNLQKKTAVY